MELSMSDTNENLFDGACKDSLGGAWGAWGCLGGLLETPDAHAPTLLGFTKYLCDLKLIVSMIFVANGQYMLKYYPGK